jgi:acetolactate synthase I/II/III large subunit
VKYSDQIADWLVEAGYTHCFYVGGGNIMHILASFSLKLDCRPFIHEVAAGIAVEYFNETAAKGKALALVTAGPGLTNIVSAMAGAYLESRELLVIGGQSKTTDLSNGKLRQNGIQEISGSKIAHSICLNSETMLDVWDKDKFFKNTHFPSSKRSGPIFLEIPLDIQARDVEFSTLEIKIPDDLHCIGEEELKNVIELIKKAHRPVILLGGGVDRQVIKEIYHLFEKTNIPIMTTWNGADRIGSEHPNYAGRPNNWGQRRSNIIQQQSDLLIAIGTRLGMQQTGFNWQEFMPVGKIIQVDIDKAELNKGHPEIDMGLCVDANDFLRKIMHEDIGGHLEWFEFCKSVIKDVPLIEDHNFNSQGIYVSPHKFLVKLSEMTTKKDIIIPCSSGGAFSIMMQAFEQKYGQKIVTNKGLASMGYGLSGAIGASIANPEARVILVEGDGGFAQNMQEIGTAAINNCNLKVFIFDDNGYASIRMTQRTYFNGRYVGCDIDTGLGLPNWESLFKAWNVPVMSVDENTFGSDAYLELFNKEGFSAFIVKIDPEQIYYPKISSRVLKNGSMESNPLHLMTPDLPEDLVKKVFKYLD